MTVEIDALGQKIPNVHVLPGSSQDSETVLCCVCSNHGCSKAIPYMQKLIRILPFRNLSGTLIIYSFFTIMCILLSYIISSLVITHWKVLNIVPDRHPSDVNSYFYIFLDSFCGRLVFIKEKNQIKKFQNKSNNTNSQ